MADLDNDVLQLRQLAVSGTALSESWCAEFCRLVSGVVVPAFQRRIPARMRSLFNAEDLAQETSLRLITHMQKQGVPENLSPALITVTAQRVLIDQWRRQRAKLFFNVSSASIRVILSRVRKRLRSELAHHPDFESYT